MIRTLRRVSDRPRVAVLSGPIALMIAGFVASPVTATAAPECRWNTTTTTPSALHEVALTAVTPSDIWEFGDNSNSTHGNTRHWDGTAWHDVPLPGPGFLSGGSAVTASDVWAVGGTAGSAAKPLFAHWDGLAWTQQVLSAGALPAKVAMVSASDGWAVGQLNGPPAGIYHFDGTNWAPVSFPLPAGAGGAYLPAVRALSVNDVWAVGSWWTNGDPGHFLPLVEHWNGANWSTMAFPTPSGRSIALHAIDGIAGDLWVAGRWQSSGGAGALVAHGDGTNWDLSPDSFGGGELDSISRVAASSVWASGIDITSPDHTFPLLTMHWDGVAWTRTPNANPTGGPTGMFTDIVGLSDGTAWLAVADFQNGHTERWLCSSASGTPAAPASAVAANAVPALPRAGTEGLEPGDRPGTWPALVLGLLTVVTACMGGVFIGRRGSRD